MAVEGTGGVLKVARGLYTYVTNTDLLLNTAEICI